MPEKLTLEEITQKLEAGVRKIYDSGQYENYLKTMSKFHNYSVNNSILIYMQKPDASHVVGFQTWKNQFNRTVNKGEKGLKIIAPSPFKIKVDVKDPVTGDVTKEEQIIPAYRAVSVFDISQTSGEPLPELVHTLDGSVENYEIMKKSIEYASGQPVIYEPITSGAKGFFKLDDKSIHIKEGMPEAQTIKTLIHETAHSLLHTRDKLKDSPKTSEQKEIEAESVAYVVARHYGIDTGDYSFGYVSGWAGDKACKDLQASMETIRQTANELIQKIDRNIEHIKSQMQPKENSPIDKLEDKIISFIQDNDYYEYRDRYDSEGEARQDIRDSILNDPAAIKDYINIIKDEAEEPHVKEDADSILNDMRDLGLIATYRTR